jgi:VIT1/CCC1 family predicted Fe2+/Mn2+ transporter
MAELSPEDQRTKSQLPRLLDARRRMHRRGADLLPHRGPTDQEQSAGVGKSGALRAAIFGINDGLLTNTALIMGFAGASQSHGVIVLAGISGLLAGAFSMGAGEYVSMRTQRELLERMLHLEAHELGSDPDGERVELAHLYRKKGVSRDLADQMATELMRDPKVALDTHAREELGIDPEEGLGSPWGAAISSFLMFAIGALLPLIPFFFASGRAAVIASGVIAAVSIATVGALTSLLTGRSPVYSALRMLLIGTVATLVTFAIGRAVGTTVVA